MTAQRPQDSGGGQGAGAEAPLDNDKTQHVNSTVGESPEDIIAKIKREEVVFVLHTPSDKTGGYLIYSLAEGSTSDGEKPFNLEIVQCEQHQLPEHLSSFLLDQGSLPPVHLSSPHRAAPIVRVYRPRAERGPGWGGYQVTVTESADTIRDFAQGLGRNGNAAEKTAVLLSGDGGVTDFLNGQDRSHPPPNNSLLPTIALLPLGTGNALFHSLHKPLYTSGSSDKNNNPTPSPLVLALRTLFKGTPSPLPTFRASFSPGAKLISAPTETADTTTPDATTTTTPSETSTPTPTPTLEDIPTPEDAPTTPKTPVTHLVGAVVASYGFHASLVWESDTPAYRVHGSKRFAMAAGELLKLGHVYQVGVDVLRSGDVVRSGEGGGAGGDGGVDGGGFVALRPGGGGAGEVEGEGESKRGGGFNYVLATLVSNLEKTFAISPESRPLDGRLRLVHFGDVGGAKTMEIMMAAYREGEHVGMPGVGYEDVEEVRVTVAEEDPRWRKVCVDGSIVELEKGGWMRVKREQRERVRVLVDASIAR
ncbi:ATP-NAD kinase-like domain-containing protein [Chaetomium sp. MPI-CAGE-AT-0009]|nr:ATP-NAD kinase-like domain-containing protein [Chaetomium sp. MPI-CAGE-AT-0009]